MADDALTPDPILSRSSRIPSSFWIAGWSLWIAYYAWFYWDAFHAAPAHVFNRHRWLFEGLSALTFVWIFFWIRAVRRASNRKQPAPAQIRRTRAILIPLCVVMIAVGLWLICRNLQR
jgi:hypothetical protein